MNDDDDLALARQQIDMARQTFTSLETLMANMEKTRRQLRQVESGQRQLTGKVASLEQQINGSPEFMPTQAWLRMHGKHATKEWVAREGGGPIRKICREMGYAIPERKVYLDSEGYGSRRWPVKALILWWPACCEREGWALVWADEIAAQAQELIG